MAVTRFWTARLALIGVGIVTICVTAAQGQAWVSFGEDPSRISAAASIINDVDCNPNTTLACEKDFAVGDLDGDGDDDLVSVRIQPFMVGGGVPNILFMNENGTMVDRTTMADGFADLTQDRDVVIEDINPDPNNPIMNMPDVIIASTFGEQPRVYMNLGCCNTTCSPSVPCAPGNQVACSPVNNNWCGLKYDSAGGRLPPFSPAPSFFAAWPLAT